MKNMAAFRITALSCFYFALLSLVSPFRSSILLTGVTAALILIVSFVAGRFEKPAIRLAFFLFPLIWIVMIALVAWPQLVLTAAGCALPVLAAALTMLLGRHTPELWRCRREFFILTGISALVLVASLNPLIYSTPTCIFIGAFLLFGILALRAGRAGQTKSVRWQAGNAGLLLLPILGAAGVGVLLMFGFGALMDWLSNLFKDTGVPMVVQTTPEAIIMDHHFRRPPLESTGGTPVPLEREEELTQSILPQIQSTDWRWILLGAVLLVALIILVWMLLSNRNKGKTEMEDMDLIVEGEPRSQGRRRRHRWIRNESNNEKVRELYRQYLNYLRVKGVSVEQSETSADVSETAKDITGDDAVLREIYRKARYDKDGTITDEELAAAKAAYQRLVIPPEKPVSDTFPEA